MDTTEILETIKRKKDELSEALENLPKFRIRYEVECHMTEKGLLSFKICSSELSIKEAASLGMWLVQTFGESGAGNV